MKRPRPSQRTTSSMRTTSSRPGTVQSHSSSTTPRKKEFVMAKIEKDIVVDVPVSVAYNQWTQFESFPEFMEGVKEVVQLDEKRLRWHAEIAGKDEEWEAEITDQVPDRH